MQSVVKNIIFFIAGFIYLLIIFLSTSLDGFLGVVELVLIPRKIWFYGFLIIHLILTCITIRDYFRKFTLQFLFFLSTGLLYKTVHELASHYFDIKAGYLEAIPYGRIIATLIAFVITINLLLKWYGNKDE